MNIAIFEEYNNDLRGLIGVVTDTDAATPENVADRIKSAIEQHFDCEVILLDVDKKLAQFPKEFWIPLHFKSVEDNTKMVVTLVQTWVY